MSDTFQRLIEEQRQVQKNFRLVAVTALSVLIFGAVFYHIVENLKWLDAFYFCTITLTTIGYGDIVPKTDLGKFFTIFYVLIGVGIIATFANLMIKNAGIKRLIKNHERSETPKKAHQDEK